MFDDQAITVRRVANGFIVQAEVPVHMTRAASAIDEDCLVFESLDSLWDWLTEHFPENKEAGK